MGIRFNCPNGHKLNVKSFLAGKRGVCPHCGAKFTIPDDPSDDSDSQTADASPDFAIPAAPQQAAADVVPAAAKVESDHAQTDRALVDAIAEAPDSTWHVHLPSGDDFGPADGPTMNRWLSEGRVSAEALVWRDDWPEWRSAASVFPQLSGRAPSNTDAPPAPPAVATTPATSAPPLMNPGAEKGGNPGSPATGTEPAAAAPMILGAEQPGRRSHRRGSKRNVKLLVSLIVVVVILVPIVILVLMGKI